MRALAMLFAVSAVSAMAQSGGTQAASPPGAQPKQIEMIKEDAPPPVPAMFVSLQGAEGKVMVQAFSLQAMAVAEPDIAAPDGALREGVVALRVTVSKSGEVTQAAEQPIGVPGDEALRQAAIDGVMKGWKYRPLLINGEPQEFQSMILLDFRDGVGKRATAGVTEMGGGVARMNGVAGMPGPGPGAVPGGPMLLSGGVAAGLLLQPVAPIYPPIARAAHVQGTVVLHAILSKTGYVENLKVISGPPMLQGAALDAVRQWKYRPYLLNGEPTEVDTTINVNFTIADTPKPDATGPE
jgi:TonB family protein